MCPVAYITNRLNNTAKNFEKPVKKHALLKVYMWRLKHPLMRRILLPSHEKQTTLPEIA